MFVGWPEFSVDEVSTIKTPELTSMKRRKAPGAGTVSCVLNDKVEVLSTRKEIKPKAQHTLSKSLNRFERDVPYSLSS